MASIVSIGTYEGNLVGWQHGSLDGEVIQGRGKHACAADDGSGSDDEPSSAAAGSVTSVLRSAPTGPLQLVYGFRAHETAIRAVCISSTGKLLVTASADETAR